MEEHTSDNSWTEKIKSKDIDICRSICKKHGKKYYLATLFLPYHKRIATWILYSFFRLADEIVDNSSSDDFSYGDIIKFKKKWEGIQKIEEDYDLENYKDEEIVLVLTKIVLQKFNIPHEYTVSFFKAMIQDTKKKRYANYIELKDYMYGSAAVVGLMMSHVIGYNKLGTEHAILLGEAMQMTNFLRDIREDYELRNRIYIPQDDMNMHLITEYDISKYVDNKKIDDKFKLFIQNEISKNRKQYRDANTGIKYLHKDGRLGVYLASRLYEKILDKIEKNGYNVFDKRVSVTSVEKIIILISSTWKLKIKKSL